MNLGTLLRANVRRFPDKPCVIFNGKSWSNQETLKISLQFACGLKDMGFKKGDRLAIFGYNSAEWVMTYLAASFAGLIVVPVSFRTRQEELIHYFKHSKVNGIVFDSTLEDAIKEIDGKFGSDIKYICLGDGVPDWAASWDDVSKTEGEPSFLEEADLCDGHSICFTSGTTGTSKGVLLTQANLLLGQHFNCLSVFPFNSEDTFVITTPLCHRTGWGRLVQAMGLGSTACILPTPFNPNELIDIIDKHKATIVGMIPTMAKMLLMKSSKADLERLNTWHSMLLTGERCPEELKKELSEELPQVGLYTFYASTETGMISCLHPEDQFKKGASVGTVAPGLEVKLDPEGEILVRSGQPGRFAVMSGYYDDQGATEKVLENGWYHTGDIGNFDEDEILYVIDRKKDLIITGGLNVSSREVEDVLCRHPLIEEAAVVSTPDPVYGESIRAFLVAKGSITSEEVVAFCGKHLAGYKKPKIVEFVSSLPRNNSGKVIKHLLKELPLEEKCV